MKLNPNDFLLVFLNPDAFIVEDGEIYLKVDLDLVNKGVIFVKELNIDVDKKRNIIENFFMHLRESAVFDVNNCPEDLREFVPPPEEVEPDMEVAYIVRPGSEELVEKMIRDLEKETLH